MPRYQAVIKIDLDAPRERQAADIEEGLHYACAILHDEYSVSANEIADLLERVTDSVYDDGAHRG